MTGGKAGFGSRDLHFSVEGTCHTQIHRCFGIPLDRIYAHFDDFSCGPLAQLDDLDLWQSLRREFWQRMVGPKSMDSPDDPDPNALYDRLIAEQGRVRSAERLFLWLGSTLAEQLLLAWLVVILRRLGIGTESIRLLSLQPRQGKIDRSIGILNHEQLNELTRWRKPTADELAAYERAWNAVSNSSPEGLIRFGAFDPPQPSPMIEALRAFMARYPAVGSGLNIWDRSILENCEIRQLKAARIVGHTLADAYYRPDWPGDFYLFERLKRLGDHRLNHPLITIFGTGTSMRHTEVVITETGQRVLDGEANFVDLNGIDDWVGGVHLNSRDGALWFYDGDTLVPG